MQKALGPWPGIQPRDPCQSLTWLTSLTFAFQKLLVKFLIVNFASWLLKFLQTGANGLVWGPLILGDQLGVSLGHPALGSTVLRPLFKKKQKKKKEKKEKTFV